MKLMTRWVPNLSSSGKLISSQNTTSHLPTPSDGFGRITHPFGVLATSQYCANVLSRSSGVVPDEKLSGASTSCGMACSVDVSVIVLPLPGGPQRMSGLWLESQLWITSTWRSVSVVGITTSDAVTCELSISRRGTETAHGSNSPSSTLTCMSITFVSGGSVTFEWETIKWPSSSRPCQVMEPPKAQTRLCRSHRSAKLAMCSAPIGKSRCDSLYSCTRLIPRRSSERSVSSSRSRVGSIT
mmetsp:Transcript_4288/g.9244  ORF Transcript_4288/g.9244 Transcript_4288/m.9244 type:complete len:241 (-) Transcript_4288:70-792(-)